MIILLVKCFKSQLVYECRERGVYLLNSEVLRFAQDENNVRQCGLERSVKIPKAKCRGHCFFISGVEAGRNWAALVDTIETTQTTRIRSGHAFHFSLLKLWSSWVLDRVVLLCVWTGALRRAPDLVKHFCYVWGKLCFCYCSMVHVKSAFHGPVGQPDNLVKVISVTLSTFPAQTFEFREMKVQEKVITSVPHLNRAAY